MPYFMSQVPKCVTIWVNLLNYMCSMCVIVHSVCTLQPIKRHELNPIRDESSFRFIEGKLQYIYFQSTPICNIQLLCTLLNIHLLYQFNIAKLCVVYDNKFYVCSMKLVLPMLYKSLLSQTIYYKKSSIYCNIRVYNQYDTGLHILLQIFLF